MLAAEIKKRMFAAMKAKAIVEKEILRVALGEITMEDARGNSSDAVTEGILKKLVKSNRETLASSTDAEQKAILEREIQILEEFLPKSLSVDAILAALAPVA
ncbi:MAG TPA: GatB/YqeY domain-containing protein, partial [Polyangiaceae bacterium]|nr:GatB/YqeY domain-containing protein [Polyangiaceae bacterium]